MESLTFVYSSEIDNRRLSNQSFLQRFYEIYLSHAWPSDQQQPFDNPTTNDASSSHTFTTVLQPKCPLECYLRLVLTNAGHTFTHLFDQPLVDLIQSMLSLNRKQSSRLGELTYMLLFEWFDHLVFKVATSDEYETVSRELQASKCGQNSTRFAGLLLLLFCPSPSGVIESYYCSRLNKRLDTFLAHAREPSQQQQQQHKHFDNYFKMWIDVLMIKNWHKYKSIVKLVDFLIKFLFYYENATLNSSHGGGSNSCGQSIGMHLIDKLIYYVRQDFGLARCDSDRADLYTENVANADRQAASVHDNEQPADSSLQALVPAGVGGVVSNWIQPSFSWLGSSLSYVVTTTTNQIGNLINYSILIFAKYWPFFSIFNANIWQKVEK
jgi:hypothetical protein